MQPGRAGRLSPANAGSFFGADRRGRRRHVSGLAAARCYLLAGVEPSVRMARERRGRPWRHPRRSRTKGRQGYQARNSLRLQRLSEVPRSSVPADLRVPGRMSASPGGCRWEGRPGRKPLGEAETPMIPPCSAKLPAMRADLQHAAGGYASSSSATRRMAALVALSRDGQRAARARRAGSDRDSSPAALERSLAPTTEAETAHSPLP